MSKVNSSDAKKEHRVPVVEDIKTLSPKSKEACNRIGIRFEELRKKTN